MMKPSSPEAMLTTEKPLETESAPSPESDIEILQQATEQVTQVLQNRKQKEKSKALFRRLAESKQNWQKEHPERLQEAEILFGFAGHMQNDWLVRKWPSPDKYLNLTEYSFTITHYILNNAHDREYLAELRRSLEEIAVASIESDIRSGGGKVNKDKVKERASERVGELWRGFVGQAATYNIMAESGLKVSLAHPGKDAFQKGDIECVNPEQGQTLDVQAKHKRKAKRTAVKVKATEVRETDTICYPAVSAEVGDQKEVVASSRATGDGPHLAELVSSRAERRQRVVTAIEIHVHGEGCDPITGVPTQGTIAKCKKRLQELGIIG